MKKIAVVLTLALAVAPAFAQTAKMDPVQVQKLQANIKGEYLKMHPQDVVLQSIAFLYTDIRNISSNDTGKIMARLYRFAGWYEQKRVSDAETTNIVAHGLSEIPFTTKDGKQFTAYSFVQMHLNDIAADGKLKEQMASTLGWTDNVAVQANSAMNVMSDWKDHLRQDAPNTNESVNTSTTDYTETEEFKAVANSLNSFRNVYGDQKRENQNFVMQSILINIADPLFAHYAQEPNDYGSFTPKDPAAFEAIKAEINKPVKVGWQTEPILIKEYVRNNMYIANNWASSEPAEELGTLLRILQ